MALLSNTTHTTTTFSWPEEEVFYCY